MPVANVTSEWSSGALVFKDNSGNAILTISSSGITFADQGSTIADLTITTDLTGVDTGTDMTAAQAGQIETDLAAIATKLNAVLAALEDCGVLASS